jgi:hypothetical protein
VNWSREDILFSIRRYVSEMLGQPWVLRFERAEIREDERPLGLIDPGASRTTRTRVSVPSGNIERAMPVTISLYPRVGTNARVGRREAEEIADLMHNLIDLGLNLGVNPNTGRPKAGPLRIPLYDYNDVEGAGPPNPYSLLWVDPGYSVRTLQDPIDWRRWTVITEMTVSWEKAGRTYADWQEGPTVQSVPGEWQWPPPAVEQAVTLQPAQARADAALEITT